MLTWKKRGSCCFFPFYISSCSVVVCKDLCCCCMRQYNICPSFLCNYGVPDQLSLVLLLAQSFLQSFPGLWFHRLNFGCLISSVTTNPFFPFLLDWVCLDIWMYREIQTKGCLENLDYLFLCICNETDYSKGRTTRILVWIVILAVVLKPDCPLGCFCIFTWFCEICPIIFQKSILLRVVILLEATNRHLYAGWLAAHFPPQKTKQETNIFVSGDVFKIQFLQRISKTSSAQRWVRCYKMLNTSHC